MTCILRKLPENGARPLSNPPMSRWIVRLREKLALRAGAYGIDHKDARLGRRPRGGAFAKARIQRRGLRPSPARWKTGQATYPSIVTYACRRINADSLSVNVDQPGNLRNVTQ